MSKKSRQKVRDYWVKRDFNGSILDDIWMEQIQERAAGYAVEAGCNSVDEGIVGVMDAFLVKLVEQYDKEWIIEQLLGFDLMSGKKINK